jgi:hypothetical protein
MSPENMGCGTRLARFLAVVLGAVFVLTLPPAILIHDLGRVLFSPERMSAILTTNLVDSGTLQQVAIAGMIDQSSLFPTGGEGGEAGAPAAESGPEPGSEFLSYLGRADLERVFAILFPPDWTRAQVESLVNDLYRWLDSDDLSPHLSLATGPLRERLLSGGLDEIMVILIDSWPACTEDQVTEMTLILAGGEGSLDGICQPAEPLRSQALAFMTDGFRQQVEALPPTLDLGGQGPAGGDAPSDGSGGDETPGSGPDLVLVKGMLRTVRTVSRWIWLIPAACLGLIMALAVRSWRSLARWWGWPLLVAGILTAAFVVLGDRQLSAVVQQALPRMEAPEAFRDLASALMGSLRTQVRGTSLAEAGLAGLTGLGLTLLPLILPRARAKPTVGTGIHASDTEESDAKKPSGLFG